MRNSFGVAMLAGYSMMFLAVSAPADTTLDYSFYKSRVEPIFMQKRPDHVRCYVCHSEATNAFKLVHMEKGQAAYTDEDSRKNFETVSRLVVPGDPAKSRLLLQPLAPQAGGNPYHSGGRQFNSKNDPEWKTIAQWVSGAKAGGK
ncbi:MAG TPA: hypothetical protein VK663_07425 [Burkholderiales bacterium]|nr:hypothetical protein [Burkholderiales bacterium]